MPEAARAMAGARGAKVANECARPGTNADATGAGAPVGAASGLAAASLCAVGQLLAKARHAAHKIALAQLHAVVAQNCVGGRAMKVEVGQHEVHEIGLAFE